MAKSSLSPTQRTLRELRALGRITGTVEKWNPYAGPLREGKRVGIRQDLFGFIDLISLDTERGIIGVQCCARSGHAAHRTKILDDCTDAAYEWLRCGGRIEIWSWAKLLVKRGGKARRWFPKVEELTIEDFSTVDEV